MKNLCVAALLVIPLLGSTGFSQETENPRAWPDAVKRVSYLSAADKTEQPALAYFPAKKAEPVPLLVALHTWSGNYLQPEGHYARWCIEKGWAMIHPNFRGRNDNPQACGSELAVQDILSAVDWAKTQANIDPDRIYLVGVSGGGHCSLLMAGRAPKLWAGVSSWCPISDLKAWHAESLTRGQNYARMMEKVCLGKPGDGDEVDKQYRLRSPLTYLAQARNVPLDINAGIHDGHSGSVPISHSLLAFNLLAGPKQKISQDQIDFMTDKAKIPAGLAYAGTDAHFDKKLVLFRRESGNTRVTLFEGGHEIIPEAALHWLAKQRRGQKASW